MKRMLMTAQEVSDTLGVKKSKAYSIIKQMNVELAEKGYMTVAGKVSRAYFQERLYGAAGKEMEGNGK